MDMPRFHILSHVAAVMILMACSESVWPQDFERQEAAARLQQVQIERVENARLIAEKAQHEAILIRGNVAIFQVIHHIDHVVYGTSVVFGQQQIENQLVNKVQQLSSEYDLTETQQSKLLLAAQWEAKQFSNEVVDLRKKYDSSGSDLIEQQIVLKQAQDLQRKRKSLFGPDSFASKVLARTVTGDQLAKYKQVLDDRLRLRHRSNIEGAIRDIERQVVLKIAQHEALVELLIKEIPPPKSNHDYDETLVKYQFSQIPEQTMRPVFDEDQWPQVRQIFDGFHELEAALVQQGLIEQEGAAASKPATNPQQEKVPTDVTPINPNRAQQDGKKP